MNDDIAADWVLVEVVRIFDGCQKLAWLEGLSFWWPKNLFRGLMGIGGKPFARVRHGRETCELKVPPEPIAGAHRFPRDMMAGILFTEKPFSAKLPFDYGKIPSWIRWLSAASLIALNKFSGVPEKRFPQWPLDLSVDSITDLTHFAQGQLCERESFALLSHDIDTPEALAELPGFLELEEELGVLSTNFIVPCGWKLDFGILDRAACRGHELGVHGYNHDNRTPFLTRDGIIKRMIAASDFVSRYKIKGYRSPSLLRSPELFEILMKYYEYDASVPNTGGFYARRGSGSATARPFYYHGLLEIPLTLPSDANLLFQGVTPEQILALWKKLAGIIIRSGGIVHLLTHGEKRYSGNQTMRAVYREFIGYLQSVCHLKFKTISAAVQQISQLKENQNADILAL